MQSNHHAIITSPIGTLGIRTNGDKLTGISFLPKQTPLAKPQASTAIAICQELVAYFEHPTHPFNIPLDISTTPFRQRLLTALQHIPVGETRTYGELAKQLQSSPRAIGQACRTNPIPIIIPCHRVIAATHLGGFSGQRDGELINIKKWLLAHESAKIS